MIVVVLLVASLWRVDCTAVLSNEDLIDLLRASELDHVFGAAFARNKYNGRTLMGVTKSDIDAEFPTASPFHRRALAELIAEHVVESEMSRSARRLQKKKDFSGYKGVQVKYDKSWITLGKAHDIKIYRTADGKLNIAAKAGVLINGLPLGKDLAARVKKLEDLTSTVCGDGKKEGKEQCDDGNTKGGDGCSAACTLEAGYTCKGKKCADTNGCAGKGCGVGAVCQDMKAPKSGFRCVCQKGFNGLPTINKPAKCASPCQGNGPVYVQSPNHAKGGAGSGGTGGKTASHGSLQGYPGGRIGRGGNGRGNGGNGYVYFKFGSGSAKFSYTGKLQTWTVPSGVKQVKASLWAGGGGGDYSNLGGGGGGASSGTILGLTPGSKIYVLVGGGGSKGVCPGSGGGGGGLTGVFVSKDYSQASAVLIAGAGSGAADQANGVGGGGTMANDGRAASGSRQGQGRGGTQTMGGGVAAGAICAGSNPYGNKKLVDATAGGPLTGGNGGMEGTQCSAGHNNWYDGVRGWSRGGFGGGGWGGAEPGGSQAGSGGGGGYYGGGGGGTWGKNGCKDGSGGGGSSFALISGKHARTLQCTIKPVHATKGYKMYRVDVTKVRGANYWCLEEMYFYNNNGRIPTKPSGGSAETVYCHTGGPGVGLSPSGSLKRSCKGASTEYMPGIAFNEKSQKNKHYYCSRNGVKTGWLAYTFDKPTVVTGYGLRGLDLAAKGVYSPMDWMFEGSNDGKKWTTMHSVSGVTTWKDGEIMTFRLDDGKVKDGGLQHYFFDTPPQKRNGYMCTDPGSAVVWSALDPQHTFPDSAAVTDIGFYTVYAGGARGCTVRTCPNGDCSKPLGGNHKADIFYSTGTNGCDFSPNYNVQNRKSKSLVRASKWTLKRVAGKTISHCPRISLARYSGFGVCDKSGSSAVCGPAAAAAGCVNKGNLRLPSVVPRGSKGTADSYHTCPNPSSPLKGKQQFFYFDRAGTGLQCKDQGSIGGLLNPGYEAAADGSKKAGHFSLDAAVISVSLYTVYGGSGRGCMLSMCTDEKCSAGHEFRIKFEHRTTTGCDFSDELKVQEYGHVKSNTWVIKSGKATKSHCPRISLVRYKGYNLCPPGVEACGPGAYAHKCVNPTGKRAGKLKNGKLKHNHGKINC